MTASIKAVQKLNKIVESSLVRHKQLHLPFKTNSLPVWELVLNYCVIKFPFFLNNIFKINKEIIICLAYSTIVVIG